MKLVEVCKDKQLASKGYWYENIEVIDEPGIEIKKTIDVTDLFAVLSNEEINICVFYRMEKILIPLSPFIHFTKKNG